MEDLHTLIETLEGTATPFTMDGTLPPSQIAAAWLGHYATPNRSCLSLFLTSGTHTGFIAAVHEGSHAIAKGAAALPMDLRVYEMADPHRKSDDIQAQAMAYGMMAVDETIDMAALCGVGEGVEALCLNSFMAQADATQLGLMGAMLAALQADIPCLIAGGMAEKNATLLARLAPEAASRLLRVEHLGLEQESDPAMALLLGYNQLTLLASMTEQETETQAA